MSATNESQWDTHWKRIQRTRLFYEKAQNKQFKMYCKLLGNRLSSQSKILEFGGGTGGLSVRFAARYGCDCTIVDNSKEAKRFFDQHFAHSKVHYQCRNAFCFNEKNKYDFVFSDGLIEHFKGPEQRKLIQIHSQAAKPGGWIALTVPCQSKRYKIITRLLKKLGLWAFGYEKPYAPSELRQLCTQNGLKVHQFKKGLWEISVLCSKQNQTPKKTPKKILNN